MENSDSEQIDKYIIFDQFRGGLTNLKIKIAYSKIIANKLNRDLIIENNFVSTRLFGISKYKIFEYFDFSHLGICNEGLSITESVKKYKFVGGCFDKCTINSIVNDLKTCNEKYIYLSGDLMLSRTCSDVLNEHLDYLYWKPRVMILPERYDICLHLRIEEDWTEFKNFNLDVLFSCIDKNWDYKSIYVLCALNACSKTLQEKFKTIQNKFKLVCINHSSECYELNAEIDYLHGLQSDIFLTITTRSTLSNTIALKRKEKNYLYNAKNNEFIAFNPSKIYG